MEATSSPFSSSWSISSSFFCPACPTWRCSPGWRWQCLWDLFRMFSRRIDRRRAENARFLALAGPAIRWLRMRRTIRRDKEHRYFKCPNCGQYLRVPRGKGKITVNCRNCGASFEERS